jgi:hypothetical protein
MISEEGESMLESSNIERNSSAWASARNSRTAAKRRAAASRAGLRDAAAGLESEARASSRESGAERD